jgi:hypothetical protein
MPEELRRKLNELTAKYNRFVKRVEIAITLAFLFGIITTAGIGKYLYDRVQDSRRDSIVQSCLDDTIQSQQNLTLLESLRVPQRVIDLAEKTYPIKTKAECEEEAQRRVK